MTHTTAGLLCSEEEINLHPRDFWFIPRLPDLPTSTPTTESAYRKFKRAVPFTGNTQLCGVNKMLSAGDQVLDKPDVSI